MDLWDTVCASESLRQSSAQASLPQLGQVRISLEAQRAHESFLGAGGLATSKACAAASHAAVPSIVGSVAGGFLASPQPSREHEGARNF